MNKGGFTSILLGLCSLGVLTACGPTPPGVSAGKIEMRTGQYEAYEPSVGGNPKTLYIRTNGMPETRWDNGVRINTLTVETMEPQIWKESPGSAAVEAMFKIDNPCSVLPRRTVTFSLKSYGENNELIFAKDVPFDMNTICR